MSALCRHGGDHENRPYGKRASCPDDGVFIRTPYQACETEREYAANLSRYLPQTGGGALPDAIVEDLVDRLQEDGHRLFQSDVASAQEGGNVLPGTLAEHFRLFLGACYEHGERTSVFDALSDSKHGVVGPIGPQDLTAWIPGSVYRLCLE